MTVPVGIVTAFFLPDTPHQTRAFFLTKEEKELGLERVQKAGKAAPVPLNWAKVKKILKGWSKFLAHSDNSQARS
jgi:MFS transporter, ACS family, pantothenate transporter